MFRLKAKVILSSSKEEIATHAPVRAIRVSNNPVLLSLFVNAPADDDNRVVQILPGNALCVESLFADISSVVTFGLGLAEPLETRHSLLTEETLFIGGKDGRSLELGVQSSVSEDILHHSRFTALTVATAHIVALRHLGDWFTVFVRRAVLS